MTERQDEGVRTTGIDLKIRHQQGVTHKSLHGKKYENANI